MLAIRSRIKNRLGFLLANYLQPYLSRTPVIWGNKERLFLDKNVILTNSVLNLRSGSIRIGENSFFGHGVMLLTGKHDMNVFGLDRQNSVPIEGRDIIIGKGVWVASGSIIIGPCVIGDNSVIGAGCVISKDIPKNSYCVMGTQDQLVTKKLRVTEPKRSC